MNDGPEYHIEEFYRSQLFRIPDNEHFGPVKTVQGTCLHGEIVDEE
jgi:hypothetical protein